MDVDVHRNTNIADSRAWGFPAWDFDAFHREELPWRLASGASEKVVWDVVGAAPIAITLEDGRAYTYVSETGAVRVEPGIRDDAGCVLGLQQRAWQDYVNEFRTQASLILAESVRILRGDWHKWSIWGPAIQSMYTGRPIYNENDLLLDSNGAPLDLHRSFTPDDDHEEMSHFLRTAGFIVVRGAIAHRRDEISREINRVRDRAREGEIFSWWTDNETTGERFPYRLLFLSELAPLVRSLMDEDPSVKKLVALAQRDLVPLHDRGQGAVSVLKPFKAGDQLAPSIAGNLGWHTDCGLGGCNVMCPSINIGIHLDQAGLNSSRLWALAGSNGRLTHGSAPLDSPKAVPLDTQPGDVTIHYSCTLHAGPPPTGDGTRRTLYLPFYAPETLQLLGRFEAFEQVQRGYGTGRLPSLDEVAEAVTA